MAHLSLACGASSRLQLMLRRFPLSLVLCFFASEEGPDRAGVVGVLELAPDGVLKATDIAVGFA